MRIAVMPNFVSRGCDFAAQLGPGVDSMAGNAERAPDFVLVEQAHQARQPDLGAEFAARHVGGGSTIEAYPQRLGGEVASKVDRYLLARGNFDPAQRCGIKPSSRISSS